MLTAVNFLEGGGVHEGFSRAGNIRDTGGGSHCRKHKFNGEGFFKLFFHGERNIIGGRRYKETARKIRRFSTAHARSRQTDRKASSIAQRFLCNARLKTCKKSMDLVYCAEMWTKLIDWGWLWIRCVPVAVRGRTAADDRCRWQTSDNEEFSTDSALLIRRTEHPLRSTTNSSALAERSRDASCLSVVSFTSTIRRAQYWVAPSIAQPLCNSWVSCWYYECQSTSHQIKVSKISAKHRILARLIYGYSRQ